MRRRNYEPERNGIQRKRSALRYCARKTRGTLQVEICLSSFGETSSFGEGKEWIKEKARGKQGSNSTGPASRNSGSTLSRRRSSILVRTHSSQLFFHISAWLFSRLHSEKLDLTAAEKRGALTTEIVVDLCLAF